MSHTNSATGGGVSRTTVTEENLRIVISVGADVPEGRLAHIDSVRFTLSPVECVVPADEISPDLPFMDPIAMGGATPLDCPLASTDAVRWVVVVGTCAHWGGFPICGSSPAMHVAW